MIATILKNILGAFVGYLIFAASALLLFHFAGMDPHAVAGTGQMVLVAIFGGVFAFLGGFVARVIAGRGPLAVNLALLFIISSFAAFSMSQSSGSRYTQYLAIFLFAPLSFLGGLLRFKLEK